MRWYIIQTYSGFESYVLALLKEKIKLYKFEKFFGKILIPTEEVIEFRCGKRRKTDRKFFPGYILIQMHMNEVNWHFIKNIPRVIGFIGGNSSYPSPVQNKEIELIINRLEKISGKPRPKTLFTPGELVRVTDGPFSDFSGVVEEIDYDKNRLKVFVSIFGRSTPVELNFRQVEKT